MKQTTSVGKMILLKRKIRKQQLTQKDNKLSDFIQSVKS